MKRYSRLILPFIIALLWLGSSCNLPAQLPATPTDTLASPDLNTPSATGTLVNETPTAFIPITGMDVLSLQCQFCVNEEVHAVLIMSDQVSFDVADPASGVTCLTAKELNGRRILLCRGAQQATFTLNVCSDPQNCLQFPVTLFPCPLIPQTGPGTPSATLAATTTPVLLTPINTLIPPTSRPSTSVPTNVNPTNTQSSPPPSTPTIGLTPVPTNTSAPSPTLESTNAPTLISASNTPEPPTAIDTLISTEGNTGEGLILVICHRSPGNTNQQKTMFVDLFAWETEHSLHGDTLGPCL